MNWGHHIKRLREEKHFTQAELASRSGLKRSHISQIERGAYKSVKESTLNKLAIALDTSVEVLTREIYGNVGEREIKETPEQILER